MGWDNKTPRTPGLLQSPKKAIRTPSFNPSANPSPLPWVKSHGILSLQPPSSGHHGAGSALPVVAESSEFHGKILPKAGWGWGSGTPVVTGSVVLNSLEKTFHGQGGAAMAQAIPVLVSALTSDPKSME